MRIQDNASNKQYELFELLIEYRNWSKFHQKKRPSIRQQLCAYPCCLTTKLEFEELSTLLDHVKCPLKSLLFLMSGHFAMLSLTCDNSVFIFDKNTFFGVKLEQESDTSSLYGFSELFFIQFIYIVKNVHFVKNGRKK